MQTVMEFLKEFEIEGRKRNSKDRNGKLSAGDTPAQGLVSARPFSPEDEVLYSS